MYRYENALARIGNSASRWSEVSLADTPIATIFNFYREVLLVLSNDVLDNLVTLNLIDAVDRFSGADGSVTVSQWLSDLADESLPTTDMVPEVVTATVKYNDVYEAGYKANLAFADGNPFSDVPDSEKEDILLTKPNLDYATFHRNCLVTVNGLIHRTDYDVNGIYVKDAGISFRRANDNHLGILSFKDVGEIECITITPEMLYNPHPSGKFKDSVYVKLPQPTNEKIVMLVLGGYLHLIDSYFHCINDQVIKIDTANLPLLHRFYESRKLISLDTMEEHHDKSINNPTQIALSELFSDESIAAYLTLSQSFVIILDAPSLYLEKHKLGYGHLPGRYFTHQKPIWPIRTELGRLPEYIAIPETDIWTIAVQDNFSTRYLFETANYETWHSVDASRVSNKPVYYAQGHFLEIGTDHLVYKTVPKVTA